MTMGKVWGWQQEESESVGIDMGNVVPFRAGVKLDLDETPMVR